MAEESAFPIFDRKAFEKAYADAASEAAATQANVLGGAFATLGGQLTQLNRQVTRIDDRLDRVEADVGEIKDILKRAFPHESGADEPEPEGFVDRVASIVESIPKGQTLSYGDVAERAGSRRAAAQSVGSALNAAIVDGRSNLPWWRVVSASGKLSTPREWKQRERLAKEGVHLDYA